MTKGEHLGVKRSPAAEQGSERAKNGQNGKHHSCISLAQLREILNDCGVDQVLGRHRGSPGPEQVESLGAGWVAEETLAIALYCALASSPDLPSGLRLAVNHGGDSDSTGAVAGHLLGARLGESAVPSGWLEALELRHEIERMADELYQAFIRREAPTPA